MKLFVTCSLVSFMQSFVITSRYVTESFSSSGSCRFTGGHLSDIFGLEVKLLHPGTQHRPRRVQELLLHRREGGPSSGEGGARDRSQGPGEVDHLRSNNDSFWDEGSVLQEHLLKTLGLPSPDVARRGTFWECRGWSDSSEGSPALQVCVCDGSEPWCRVEHVIIGACRGEGLMSGGR